MDILETPGHRWAKYSPKAEVPAVDGYFKVRRRGVVFFDASKREFAFLVANKFNERFFVTCARRDGRLWFMHALSEGDAARLGLAGLGLGETRQLAETLWSSLSIGAAAPGRLQ